MSDISSYYNSSQKRYLYKKTVFQYNASGASGASGVSGMSGAAGATGASGVSGMSGTSGSYVVVDVEVTKLTITEVINLFTTGNLKESEMETWLRKNTAISGIKVERKGSVITYKFKYIGTTQEDALIGLDAGRNHIVLSGLFTNPLREEKYGIPKNPESATVTGFVAHRKFESKLKGFNDVNGYRDIVENNLRLAPVNSSTGLYGIVLEYDQNNPENPPIP